MEVWTSPSSGGGRTTTFYWFSGKEAELRERSEGRLQGRGWGGGRHLRGLFLLIKLMEKDEEVAFNLG